MMLRVWVKVNMMMRVAQPSLRAGEGARGDKEASKMKERKYKRTN